MMFRAAVFSALVAVASAQVCSICGDGQRVPEGSKDEVFMFPGQPTVPCGTLEQAGVNGQIPIESCPFLPGLVNACNCEPGTIQPPTAPTPAPIAPTPAPVIPTAAPIAPVPAPVPAAPTGCPDIPPTGCSICGDGLCVGNGDALFSFPGQPSVPCSSLEIAGITGQVPLDQCPFLPGLTQACECGTGPAPMPTDAPVAPTPAPVAPTPAPVEPTDAPVTDAPFAPVTAAPVAPTPFPVFIMTPSPVEATAAPADTTAPVQGEGDDDDDDDDDGNGDDDDDDDEEDSSDEGMGMRMGMKSKTQSAMSKSRKKMGMSAMGMARKLGAQGIPAAVGFRGVN